MSRINLLFTILSIFLTSALKAQLAYIALENDNSLQIFDLNTNTQVNTISMLSGAARPVVNDDFTLVYVVQYSSNSIGIVSTASQSIIGTIPVGAAPTTFEIVPGSPDKAYVINQGVNNVYEIDLNTNTVVDTILVGSYPNKIAFSPDGSIAYVTNCFSFNISVINTLTNSVITTISTPGETPADVKFSPDGSTAYVSLQAGTGNVAVINTSTHSIITSIAVGYQPHDLIFSPDGAYVYVTNSATNTVSIINTSTLMVVATLNVETLPQFINLSLDEAGLYVSNNNSSSLSYIDILTNTVTATIPVGNGPSGLVVVPKNVSVSENQTPMNFYASPNPCSKSSNVSVFFEKSKAGQLMMFDMQGNLVMTSAINGESDHYSIATGSCQSGQYILVFICEDETHTEKLIIGDWD